MLTALLGFAASMTLILLRVPIALALGIVGFGGFALVVGTLPAATMVALSVRETASSYNLIVIPLFILMGNFVVGAGISKELYRTASAFMGHRRGGLALSTIVASGGFSTVCGSSVATVVTIGRVAVPAMRDYGYSDRLSTATVAAGATLGLIIPPSILLVIYGIVTDTHIGKLYAAGLLPGILGMALYMGAVYWTALRHPESAPRAERVRWRQRLAELRNVLSVLILALVVLVGIYSGYFTAGEASGVGAFGAFLITLARGRFNTRMFLDILKDTAITSTILLTMIIGAGIFSEFLNYSDAHESLLTVIRAVDFPPIMIVIIISLIYIVLGAIMEELSMLLLTLPIFFPIIVGLGFDPVWFGILVIVLCELGLITPPIGINLFIMRTVAPNVSLRNIIAGIVPFIVADLARVALLIAFPIIALALPGLFF